MWLLKRQCCLCFGFFSSHEVQLNSVPSPSNIFQIVLLSVAFGELLSCLLHLLWVMIDCFFLRFISFYCKIVFYGYCFILGTFHGHWAVEGSSPNRFPFASAWSLCIKQGRPFFSLRSLYNRGNAWASCFDFWLRSFCPPSSVPTNSVK